MNVNTVYTIGYEGTDIKGFVATLIAAKVTVLADVRALAISRKKGFSKNRLREALENVGIEYRHFVELGDPKNGRTAARAGKFDLFRKIYSAHLKTSDAQLALTNLSSLAENSVTCLMCFERDPNVCHRNIIADELKNCGILIFHLFGDSPSRYVRNNHLLPSRSTHQSGASRQ
jgi:uncharacterized protein (DUF488 family)